jgi:hypothetical protein
VQRAGGFAPPVRLPGGLALFAIEAATLAKRTAR